MQAPAQSGRRWWGGRDGVGDAGSDGGDDGGGGGSSYSGDGITKTAEESPSIDKSWRKSPRAYKASPTLSDFHA